MKQEPQRRKFLKELGSLGAVATMPTRAENADAAASTTPTPPGHPHLPLYASATLMFFTSAEADFVNAAVSCFIPSDELGPGAAEAGVTLFIDRQLHGAWGAMARGYRNGPWIEGTPQQGYQLQLTPREIYRTAIQETDRFCASKYGKRFAELPQRDQDAVLKGLDEGNVTLETLPGTLFVNVMWSNTQEGFFADPIYGGNKDKIGWRLVGFPGVAAAYGEHVEQHGTPYDVEPVGIEDVLRRAVELDEHGHPIHKKLTHTS